MKNRRQDEYKAQESIADCSKKEEERTGNRSKLLRSAASIGKGFRLIALGMDTFYLWKSTQAMLKEVRE